MPLSGREGESSNIISTGQRATFGLTHALSRQREREIWSIFPVMSGIRVDETAMGDYSIKERLKSDRRSELA
jgi:hypothetical protein